MAAPSGIKWGSIAGGYGRIGIYTSVTKLSNKTQAELHVEVWFWSKYSVSDSSNTYYYDNLSSSGSATTNRGSKSISTTVASGSGWSTSNQVKIGESNVTYNRGTSASTRYLYAKLTNIDRVGATMTVSTTAQIPALDKYTITYNVNGGTGTVNSQTKYHGKSATLANGSGISKSGYSFQGWGTSNTDTSVDYKAGASYSGNANLNLYAIWKKTITLSYNANGGSASVASQSASVYNATTSYKFTITSNKPGTKTGHTFLGWSTSKTATSASYSGGGNITLSSSTTLYAVWKPNEYTITYNDNGGSGAPGNQTKKYGQTLTLSSTIPTRENYNFLGWATTTNATTPTYFAGGSYTANSAATLYAVWASGYTKPRITEEKVVRCTSEGIEVEDGENVKVTFKWGSSEGNPTAVVAYKTQTEIVDGHTETLSGTSGTYECYFYNVDPEKSYIFGIAVVDDPDRQSETMTAKMVNLFSGPRVIDVKDKGKGISFGKSAELEDTADFGWAIRPSAGYDHPFLEPETDLNDVLTPNIYIGRNVSTYSYGNCPFTSGTFTLEVTEAGEEGQRRQRIQICHKTTPIIYERFYYQSKWGDWLIVGWTKPAITVGLTDNVTIGVAQSYEQIPFNKSVISTGSTLSLSNGSVVIGPGVRYVRVSGQISFCPGTYSGNRHVRIRKTSNGSYSYASWLCYYSWSSTTTTINDFIALSPTMFSVTEGDLIDIVFYTQNTSDYYFSGSSANGYRTYLTVEAL